MQDSLALLWVAVKTTYPKREVFISQKTYISIDFLPLKGITSP